MEEDKPKSQFELWRQNMYIIIYGTNTKAGRLFDVALLWLILLSVVLVMLESVREVDQRFHMPLLVLEWVVTVLFTIEYILRVICINKPFRYIFSFYGIIDLLSILPMYLSFFFTGTHVLASIRSLRLLRVFRILKLMRFLGEAKQLREALKASRTKITVFIYSVLIVSVVVGTLMYVIESNENGFTSIPRSIYWTIVTLTTVGYGDIAPQTPLGQFLAAIVMILGYGVIAVPTGIVTAEFTMQKSGNEKEKEKDKTCLVCNAKDHPENAQYCYKCGQKFDE